MLKKASITLLLILLLAGCTKCKGVKTTPDGGEPPVILDYYAAESIRPGASWRVYLKAQDADGDMKDIVAQVWQPGVGYYPTDFTYLKGADREGFAGYLFLKTPTDSRLLQDNFKLELFLRDCEQNKSEAVYMTLKFHNQGSYRPQDVPEEWREAAKRRLGGIQIQIQSSEDYNSDGEGKTFIP